MATNESVRHLALGLKAAPETAASFGDFNKVHPAVNEGEYKKRQAQRRELYAIAAVLTQSTVDHAIATAYQRPPYGLTTPLGSPDEEEESYSELKYGLGATLQHAYKEVAESRQMRPIVERLDYAVGAFRGGRGEHRYESARRLMNSGIGTACKLTVDCLDVVVATSLNAEPNRTLEEIAQIAHASVGVVHKVAAVNIDQLSAASATIEAAARHSREQEQVLAVKSGKDGQEYVDFIKPVGRLDHPHTILRGLRPTNRYYSYIGDIACENDTLGCPALVRLNGANANEKLWHWTVGIAAQNGTLADMIWSHNKVAAYS